MKDFDKLMNNWKKMLIINEWKKEDEEQQKYFDETMIDQNIDEYKGMIDLWRSFGGD